MPTATSPRLASYTSPPPAKSQTLITSCLATTSNWLVLRFICDALPFSLTTKEKWQQKAEGAIGLEEELKRAGGRLGTMRVVLVSFLRGWTFWRGEAKRVGIDLNRLSMEHKFAFVDGITALLPENNDHTQPTPPLHQGRPPVAHTPHLPIVTRNPPLTHPVTVPQKPSVGTKLQWTRGGDLEAIERGILSAIEGLNRGVEESCQLATAEDVLLIIDQPDALLAILGEEAGIGALEIQNMIMSLRQHVHSTIVTAAADSPLIHYEEPGTTLEVEHKSLVLGMAYQSRMVMQLRGLETGAARDISGVLQISRGASHTRRRKKTRKKFERNRVVPTEVLYFVQGDGAVRVFERGE